jgi:hypothetical protein
MSVESFAQIVWKMGGGRGATADPPAHFHMSYPACEQQRNMTATISQSKYLIGSPDHHAVCLTAAPREWSVKRVAWVVNKRLFQVLNTNW